MELLLWLNLRMITGCAALVLRGRINSYRGHITRIRYAYVIATINPSNRLSVTNILKLYRQIEPCLGTF